MLEIYNSYSLQTSEIFLILISSVAFGMAKTGLGGFGMLAVPIMAAIFGAKPSTGIVLILLIFADVFGVWFYHRHADMRMIMKLSPSTIFGIFLGIVIGDNISDTHFALLMAIILILGALLMALNMKDKLKVKPGLTLSFAAGTFAGISTMIGNSAGPVMSIYFLAMGLEKNRFIGTGAWFFLLVNLFKLPFHIFIWETIDTKTLLLDLTLIPTIVIGAFMGVWIVKKIPDKPYRLIVIISVVIAAIQMSLNSI